MGNWIDLRLDVLASSPMEINDIEAAMQQPCDELVTWVANRDGKDPKEIMAPLKALLSFEPKLNLFYTDSSVNQARRFEKSFPDRCTGIVQSHVGFVSKNFPASVILAEHWNDQVGYASRRVIRAGQEIRCSYDRNQKAQCCEWILPNIFAPYLTEYELGLQFGSLWDQWIDEMQTEFAAMKAIYGGLEVEEQKSSGV